MNDAAHAPADAAPRDRSLDVSRRGLLLGGAAIVVAGGGGVAVGALRTVARDEPAGRPPPDLVAALAAERELIAAIDATTGGNAAVRTALHQIRANHLAHLAALRFAVQSFAQSPASAGSSGPSPAQALTVAGLRGAEESASARAAARAARLSGAAATLLASIAACEASHAELFG